MELNSELDRLEAEVNRLMKYDEIQQELERAEKKHPVFPKDMFHQLAIMQEEAGEVTKAVLHYHYEGGTIGDIHDELVQTAAMCMRMLQYLSHCKRVNKVCRYCGSVNVVMFDSDNDLCNCCHRILPGM